MITNGNTTVFGYTLNELRRITYEFQSAGVDPKRLAELAHENAQLREENDTLRLALVQRFDL